MITCKLQGGLGNQLFQIFTTISYALDHSKPFFFLNNYQLGTGSNGETIRYTYWKTLLSSLKPFLKNMEQIPTLEILYESTFHYNPLPTPYSDMLLVGYFQSPKYFDHHKLFINNLLQLDKTKNQLEKKFNLRNKSNEWISMHFRIGDYVNYPDLYNILDVNYYYNALSYISKKYPTTSFHITCFYEYCDNEHVDHIIYILEYQFPLYKFYKKFNCPDYRDDDWIELLEMSLHPYNIIANSTFSWWAAYLNNNENKLVCYPEKWFHPEANKDTSDLIPNDWIQISCSQDPEVLY